MRERLRQGLAASRTTGPRVAGQPRDAHGDEKLRVARQVMRLTRLDPKICKDVVEGTPVTLLRVPDLAMADAARTILELAGATVSIAAPTG